MHVLVVDAAKPTAPDGLASRAAALGALNVPVRAIATGTNGVPGDGPEVGSGGTASTVREATSREPPHAVLVGHVPADEAQAVADALEACDAPVVVDASATEPPEAVRPLLEAADVAIADARAGAPLGVHALDGERPVVRVLQALLDQGASAVGLLGGERHDGFKNETGLRLSAGSGSPAAETSAVTAGLLARDYEPVEAWNEARLTARRIADLHAAPRRLAPAVRALMAEHAHATFILEEELNTSLLPREGGNLALAAHDAEGPDRVVDLRGRLVGAGARVRMAGERRLGGDSEAVGALLAARRVEKGVRACVTLASPCPAADLAGASGLDVRDAEAPDPAAAVRNAGAANDLPDAIRTRDGTLLLFAAGTPQLLNRARALATGTERLREG